MHGAPVLASSSVYETEPVGEVVDQRDFFNACVRIEDDARAGAAAGRLQGGRARARARAGEAARHGPRPIDVDLLLLEDVEYESERLRLPHREVTTRRFVLVPLLELDPELVVPGAAAPPTRWPRSGPARRSGRAGPPLDVRG